MTDISYVTKTEFTYLNTERGCFLCVFWREQLELERLIYWCFFCGSGKAGVRRGSREIILPSKLTAAQYYYAVFCAHLEADGEGYNHVTISRKVLTILLAMAGGMCLSPQCSQ